MPSSPSTLHPPRTDAESTPGSGVAPTDEVLRLLEDECSRAILIATRSEAHSARELVERCDASRATVYRRLDSLREAGLLEAGMAYDPDGHHRTVFEAVLDELTVGLAEDGLSIAISTDRPASGPDVA